MASDYSKSLAKKLLFDPLLLGANRLCILSPEATPSMASWLLTTYDEQKIQGISVELIITSVSDHGISKANHDGFKVLHKTSHSKDSSNTFFCSYFHETSDVNKSTFIWLNNDVPIKAFSCSCNFTQGVLLKSQSCSIFEQSASEAYHSYEKAVDNSIYCINSEVEDYIVIDPSYLPTSEKMNMDDPNYISLSLVTKRTGEPGTKSGLNWGQRKKRNRNEAYIPLPRKIAKSDFFPLNEQHFLVVTDDHHTLQLRVEQEGNKAITTPASNAQLGEYFRNRLGLANGAYVRLADLDAYGRRDVSFYKIDEEQYYMDFSVSEKR